MSKSTRRILLVGASSLLGREVAEELNAGAFAEDTVVLLDSDVEPGKLEDIGGEATVLQAIEPASFEGADAVIFATAADAGRYWEDAVRFGAAAIDATGTVQGLPVLSPRLGRIAPLTLESTGVSAAHPVATMLAAVLLPLQERGLLQDVYATVLQPVSEHGGAALDELHQQTVQLLSFQSVPTEQHDTQVAFNLLPRLGEDAKFDLAATARLVERQLATLVSEAPKPALQWVQAPVFHGYAVSMFVKTSEAVDRESLEEMLHGELVELVAPDDPPASNIAVAGQDKMLAEVAPGAGNVLRFWIVADNLKLLAQTAVACTAELLRMRPTGVVQ
ncbi:Asd/ArgC dimerization domain-containing protein [Terriglobus sp.]|uniref:Asd/ArgC dimerization domain-containing protein n=1 Tax=Terriglobus sp. TaxID=1889013 RepID=UPI003B002220